MATFIQIDERAGILILAAVLVGVAFYVAPDATMNVVENARDAITGAMP